MPVDCAPEADANAEAAKGCVVDTFAVFVDGAGGNDANDGTKAKPFKTIRAAIANGPTTGRRRIYVCGDGTYPEHLELKTAMHLFGGFACASWTPQAGTKPRVAPNDAGYALHVASVATAVRFEDIAFEAIAGTASARSSIAVFVSSSPQVTFKRANITAGAGADGIDGVVGKAGVATPASLKGNNADTAGRILGGAAKTCTCTTGGSSTGGRGGDSNGTELNGMNGLPVITPPLPEGGTQTGAGQTQANCNAGTLASRTGSNAPAGTTAPRSPLGVLDVDGWKPGDGATGVDGTPGQGGGGGGSRSNTADFGGGGGGGCGGCGGGAGTGGAAGGISIALLAFTSPVTLVDSELIAARAGNGGAGKAGAPGGAGGGKGDGSNDGCDGSSGGRGGDGGAGAGGAGGISAAVLYANGEPKHSGTTFTASTKGAGGAGGKAPDNTGPDGREGERVDIGN